MNRSHKDYAKSIDYVKEKLGYDIKTTKKIVGQAAHFDDVKMLVKMAWESQAEWRMDALLKKQYKKNSGKKSPEPRRISFMGMSTSPLYRGDTWIEAEEASYPDGGFTRRAYVRFEDGKLRVVKCSIPDTYFTIPAKAKISGKTVNGYITVLYNGDEYIFVRSKRGR